MIRVVLRGRTGNHLFQYAVGRHLSERHAVPLVLDASWMRNHDYLQAKELVRLPLKAELKRGLSVPARALRAFTGKHHLEWKYRQVWKEPADDLTFNPAVVGLGSGALLIGYFQSWRYFSMIRGTLLQELDFNHLGWKAEQADLRDEMSACASVAVHVRRTDYLNYKFTQVCGETYHQRAMDLLRQRLPNPIFYFFSDDLEWCRNRFQSADCRFVDIPGAASDPFIDMRLMANAKHNIIVNSSYSWWAAWLNRNPDQKVISPDAWGVGGPKIPMEDKILDHWKMIPG